MEATGPNPSRWSRSTAGSAVAPPPSASMTARCTATRPGSRPVPRGRSRRGASLKALVSEVAPARSASRREPAWPTTPCPSALTTSSRRDRVVSRRKCLPAGTTETLDKPRRCSSEGTSAFPDMVRTRPRTKRAGRAAAVRARRHLHRLPAARLLTRTPPGAAPPRVGRAPCGGRAVAHSGEYRPYAVSCAVGVITDIRADWGRRPRHFAARIPAHEPQGSCSGEGEPRVELCI